MKTNILIALLFCVTNLFAQTNFYTSSKVFNEGTYRYQCDVSSSGNVYLYNISNNWIGLSPQIKEGNVNFVLEDIQVELTTEESWLLNRTKFGTIMDNALSSIDDNTWTKHGTLYVNFYVNTDTGKVDDVRFYFDRDSSFVYLPISFYSQLELAIKEQFHYVLTELGRNLTFVYQWQTY